MHAVPTPIPQPPAPSIRGAVEALVQFFEHLTPGELPRLYALYARDAVFKDPFNEVRGTQAIERIFRHMFEALDSPYFVVTGRVMEGRQCFLTWEFHFRFRRFSPDTWQVVRGTTHLVFDEQCRVSLHRDYWDAAEELYEKLPLVGGLMRWLKRRARD
jgi:ketosteroid isomerase-like protein